MSEQPHYRVLLRALPLGVSAAVRLRRFLKAALRAYGLVAVKVEEVSAQGEAREQPEQEGTVSA